MVQPVRPKRTHSVTLTGPQTALALDTSYGPVKEYRHAAEVQRAAKIAKKEVVLVAA